MPKFRNFKNRIQFLALDVKQIDFRDTLINKSTKITVKQCIALSAIYLKSNRHFLRGSLHEWSFLIILII